MSLHLLCEMALDRFGDFVSDEVGKAILKAIFLEKISLMLICKQLVYLKAHHGSTGKRHCHVVAFKDIVTF